MSNRFISRDQVERYERWEWNSLGQGKSNGTQKNINTPAGDISIQTSALDLEQLQQKAIEEGRVEGYAEGRAIVHAEVQRLQTLMQSADERWHQLHETAAAQVLDLALELARHILRHEITVHPEMILPVVREVLETLTDNGSHAQLLLHPSDAQLVREHLIDDLKQGGWKIIEDPRITPGGCRINTNHGEVDATLEKRWERVISPLGRNLPWQVKHQADPQKNDLPINQGPDSENQSTQGDSDA